MTQVHTCILWRFLSLGKEPIKSSKRVVSVASSCVSVKTESLLLFPTDLGNLCWFRRWSPAGFLPSPTSPLWVSWFRDLFSVSGPASCNRHLKWQQCDLKRSTICSDLWSPPWIHWYVSECSHFNDKILSRWGLENLRSSTEAMFANLLIHHAWP